MTKEELKALILEQFQSGDVDEGWREKMAALGLGASLLTSPVTADSSSKKVVHKPAISKTSSSNKKPIVQSEVSKAIETDIEFAHSVIAATLVDEAIGEPRNGMQGVLNVIMNRSGGNIVKAAKECLKQSQFSGWNKVNKSSMVDVKKFIEQHKKNPAKFKEALNLVKAAESHSLADITKGADHFLNTNLVLKATGKLPDWYDEKHITNVIGNHTFLNLKKSPTTKTNVTVKELKDIINEVLNEL
jgi:hypothetical protein